jgi:Ca-activated chloride channel homolog
VPFAPHQRSWKDVPRCLVLAVAFLLWAQISARAQVPNINMGPDSGFAQIDFAQMYLDQVNRDSKKRARQLAEKRELIESGTVSALDLEAPNKAVEEFNHATSQMKAQHSKEAIQHLQKAIAAYPKFVSAHIALGLAYLDQEDRAHAKSEFEVAAKLDPKFPGSFLNLGLVALSNNDFSSALPELEKAASLKPKDPRILSSLAYAQNGTHQYQQTLETARLAHTLNHKGMANVHYVAASAALSLKDFEAMERELNFFLSEDPTNPFAPVARQNLASLAHNRAVRAAAAGSPSQATTLVASLRPQTFPNSERLKSQLSALGDESDSGNCEDCGTLAERNAEAGESPETLAAPPTRSGSAAAWTIHTNVDQVTLFFSVTSHGHMVNDLQQSDIRILDDNKPPEKIEQFAPQSKLPLRLALLVDTSGSVHDRFSFEKHAATEFVRKMLSGTSDLGFIAGFSEETTVTQDFSAESTELGKGIEKLANGGGTALFDAVSYACRKLAAYPENQRVARVLVVLSDGEDNSSHTSLNQSLRTAERAGVTIYTVSTREDRGDKTDADRILEVLAERTGGEAMFPGDILTLGKSFDKLHDLIRSRYFVAYKPANFQSDGSYRAISVIAERDGKRLQVRSRRGYHTRLATTKN